MMALDSVAVAKLIAGGVLYLVLPLSALTYYLFRRDRRTAEMERIFSVLHIDLVHQQPYQSAKSGYYFLCAVAYASAVSGIGLMLLFLSTEMKLTEFPGVEFRDMQFPHAGSRLVVSMAFLGAYLWGLQYIFRRYALNDLIPSVYYSLSMRMLLAAVTALVLYNVYAAFADTESAGGGITSNVWPALAFLIGAFPQRGVRWLTERIPMLAPEADPTVRRLPLEMIEGIESHDSLRLEELGIDTCYDLAMADFVPLVLKTPYSARQLVDWILQAKMCIYFGETVKELRQHGIRTIIDLEHLTQEDIEILATETAATRSALQRAVAVAKHDAEIGRLRTVGQLLGTFIAVEDDVAPPVGYMRRSKGA
jgi:hypothetical protein